MKVKNVYLDSAAATPMSSAVFDNMKPYLTENFYNPSSPYLPGKHVKFDYETYKDQLARTIGAKGDDLVITSGATESNNIAFTVLKNYKNAHVLVLATEHASVLNIAKNYGNYDLINVDKNGRIDLNDLKAKIKDNTVLISVSLVNNELGTIQPISEIAQIVRDINSTRTKMPLYLHSDASQAFNLMDIYVSRLGVDLLTINSAKIYGPKGIGALYIKQGIKLSPITFGGGQENGLRSGTENVAGLVGFATAAKIAKDHANSNRKHAEEIKRQFKTELESKLTEIKGLKFDFIGSDKNQLANFLPICFDGMDAERLIYKLEEKGVFVSTGAACAASKGQKSHVLKAIGLTDSQINGSLRISFPSDITKSDVTYATTAITDAIKCERLITDKSCSAKTTVFVGLSGGVDSSVSAKLLKDAGYHVVGVYMKNWSKDLPGMKCPWADDLADAKRIAVKLGIDFQIFDFENEYKAKVVDVMMSEFKAGRTPNPDVMCNEEIKFKLFYDIAREKGADMIATGHYAQVKDKKLCLAKDDNKDQTYFLYRISQDAVEHTLFPVGGLKKPDVKKLAQEFGFDNAYKKESMGICFVGEANIEEFIKEYLRDEGESEYNKYISKGDIIDRDTNKVLGYHEGAIFYTLGQRHGLDVGGGLPYYVTGKDMKKNIVYVSKNLNDDNFWVKELHLTNLFLRQKPAKSVKVRLRHRAELIDADIKISQDSAILTFKNQIKRTAPGQSCVIYDGDICCGGGYIA